AMPSTPNSVIDRRIIQNFVILWPCRGRVTDYFDTVTIPNPSPALRFTHEDALSLGLFELTIPNPSPALRLTCSPYLPPIAAYPP
ncbi:MAG: hypothetical protein KF832_32250, partial [Caldilineaceae bacterium]|nr:hypothetical protein [Caldilineaceae bacterium]